MRGLHGLCEDGARQRWPCPWRAAERARRGPSLGWSGTPVPPSRSPPVASKPTSAKIDTIVALCKRRGFVFASGEMHGLVGA